MDYETWFEKRVKPSVIVDGNVSIREFGAIVHRATLRGDIVPIEDIPRRKNDRYDLLKKNDGA